MENIELKWAEAKSTAVRIVCAPGPKVCFETAYQPDGSRVVRTKSNRDGYVTVAVYKATLKSG